MLDAADITMKTNPTMLRSSLLRSSMMTRAERTQGRFMRAPDHPSDAPPASPADPVAPAGDAPAADAPPADGEAPPADVTEGTILGGDTPADGEKPAEGEAPKPAAPEAYDLKMPEGMTLDADALAIAEPIFREMNLDNEGAQKLTDAYAKIAPQIAERAITADRAAQQSAIVEQRAAWAAEAKADPEIGGANWTASVEASAKALERLGAPAGSPFRVLLNDSGLGNHPEMIRMFAKIGKAIGEDTDFVSSSAREATTREDKYYGKSA